MKCMKPSQTSWPDQPQTMSRVVLCCPPDYLRFKFQVYIMFLYFLCIFKKLFVSVAHSLAVVKIRM